MLTTQQTDCQRTTTASCLMCDESQMQALDALEDDEEAVETALAFLGVQYPSFPHAATPTWKRLAELVNPLTSALIALLRCKSRAVFDFYHAAIYEGEDETICVKAVAPFQPLRPVKTWLELDSWTKASFQAEMWRDYFEAYTRYLDARYGSATNWRSVIVVYAGRLDDGLASSNTARLFRNAKGGGARPAYALRLRRGR